MSGRIPDLDKVIHERTRMAIMSLLVGAREMSFTELRESLGLTDGNLSVHLKTLQRAGYLAITKSYRNRRPLTTVALTEDGRSALKTYVDQLEVIIRRARGLEP